MKTKTLRPFGFRDKIGYMFGDFGNDFTFILSTMLLMKFYTDVMGVSAGIVGTIMMIARFVDAVTDVTMGRICDRSRVTEQGKFKPWIARMCVPVAIASFLMYLSPLSKVLSGGWMVAYLALTYILWGSIFYTSINIPYGSMASAISADPGDRQSLSTFRTMGGMFAGLVIGLILPLVAYDKIPVRDKSGELLYSGGKLVTQDVLNGNKSMIAAAVFSVFAIICYILCYNLVTERVQPKSEGDSFQNNSVLNMIKNAVTNRALLSIIVASIVMLLAQLTMQNMAAYIFPDYFNQAKLQVASMGCMMIGMAIAAVVAKPLATKFGKAEVSIVSNLFAALICGVLFFIHTTNVWVYIALQALCWLGLGVFSMVSWALITDVIDYSELKNGVREDGSVYAVYSFARKLGQALAAGVSGYLLEAIGYVVAKEGETVIQSQAVKDGIYDISTIVPAIGFLLLGLVLWFWYPLHKKQVDENVATLKEKHSQEA